MKTKRRYLCRGEVDIFNETRAAAGFVLQTRAPQSTPWRAMTACGRTGLLVLALVACTAADVRAFVLSPAVPATSSTYRSSKLPTFTPATSTSAAATSTTRSSYTTRNARHPAATALMSMSSPFENVDYDDEDAARQEAQQLEDMIRGRRGIVLEAVEREWRAEMLKTVEEEGERLCDEAYEGFSTRGRGAIFVNVDMGLSSSNKGHSGAACHAVFRSLEEVVVERSSRVDPSDQMQIIQRCQEYDPEAGFVLVFGHKGMLGVQVMRPSKAPREIHRARRAP